jgi:hypothetical protein
MRVLHRSPMAILPPSLAGSHRGNPLLRASSERTTSLDRPPPGMVPVLSEDQCFSGLACHCPGGCCRGAARSERGAVSTNPDSATVTMVGESPSLVLAPTAIGTDCRPVPGHAASKVAVEISLVVAL